MLFYSCINNKNNHFTKIILQIDLEYYKKHKI